MALKPKHYDRLTYAGQTQKSHSDYLRFGYRVDIGGAGMLTVRGSRLDRDALKQHGCHEIGAHPRLLLSRVRFRGPIPLVERTRLDQEPWPLAREALLDAHRYHLRALPVCYI